MSAGAERFASLLIADDSSIRGAMEAINGNGREIVLIRDASARVSGLVTDGDIRRGLLAGLSLESPVAAVMRRDFFAVAPDVDRATVLDIMKARMFQHVPVLDAERRLVAIHFLRDLLGAAPKPNIAVVMAGGKGLRLLPMTESIPKPMVEVAGRPMLERILLHLVSHGVLKIFVAVNYKAEMIERHFGDGIGFGCEIVYLRENQPLGTGGALSLLPALPGEPFFLLNGDQIMRADLTAMLEWHVRSNAAATVGVGPYHVDIPFGTVTVRDGWLTSLDEKPTLNLLVNRGIYILNPSTLAHVPRGKEFPVTALFEKLLELHQPVGAFYFDDYWLDVGRPADLRTARGFGAA